MTATSTGPTIHDETPTKKFWTPHRFLTVLTAVVFLLGLCVVLWPAVRQYAILRQLEKLDCYAETEPISPEWLRSVVDTKWMSGFERVTSLALEPAGVQVVLDHHDLFSQVVTLELTDPEGIIPIEVLRQLFAIGPITALYWDAPDDSLEPASTLKQLEFLDLRGSTVSDKGLSHLKGLTTLRHVNLNRTFITDVGLQSLSQLKNLKNLSLANTTINGSGFSNLTELDELGYLDLSGSTIQDEELIHLTKLKRLEYVYLDATQITDAGITNLSGSSLQEIGLYGTSVTDEGLKALGQMPTIRMLDLGGTAITDAGLVHLTSLPHLERLRIYSTAVSDDGLKTLSTISSLKELNVEWTRITKSGIREFVKSRSGVWIRYIADENE